MIALFEYKGLKIAWLGHDGFKISNGITIYIDPYQAKASGKADVLLITHEHFDHLSEDDIRNATSKDTVIITIPSCRQQVSKLGAKEVKTVKPGDKLTVGDVGIEAVAAYNTNKFREPGKVFHPKEDGKVGFMIALEGVRIYHAGDTDEVPEMRGLNPDIALLPVSGTYVMTAQEAAAAAKTIKPKIAIPMHYAAIVGSPADAEKFKQLADCEVRILEKE